ncbi:MAG: bifunctional oligoribonuclease/PAP phosphatase NrnA, partial [Microgenomates group bacterium]
MNYQESQQILEEIKKANNILINCHRSPDPDSVSSALSMNYVLSILGKNNVEIICPDDIPDNCRFLPDSDKIKKEDFDKFDFTKYDLLIALDSGDWDQITGGTNIKNSGIKVLMVDHHHTNPNYGDIGILDPEAPANCEVLTRLFEDMNIPFDSNLSTILLTGIIADTVSFQIDDVTKGTFSTALKLIENGADRKKIIFNLNRSKPLDELLLMGEMFSRIIKDDDGRFVWTAIPKDLSQKFPNSRDAKAFLANSFIQSVADTDFGMVMEEKEDFLTISFRSRTDFDVSKIAKELGGGGHS